MHQVHEEADLIEQAVLVLRVLPLRNRVLLQRFLSLPGETEGVPKVRPHIGVIATFCDRVLILANRIRPLLVIVS